MNEKTRKKLLWAMFAAAIAIACATSLTVVASR
jgi:hypothetical protein